MWSKHAAAEKARAAYGAQTTRAPTTHRARAVPDTRLRDVLAAAPKSRTGVAAAAAADAVNERLDEAIYKNGGYGHGGAVQAELCGPPKLDPGLVSNPYPLTSILVSKCAFQMKPCATTLRQRPRWGAAR
jgi:hypothetical protein